MSLVFENELHDMTATAEEVLPNADLLWLEGEILFKEVPYYGYRTDIVTVSFNEWDLARRKKALGHLTPLPDERKYRRSYRQLQRREPMTRYEWIHEDSTYHTEQTCREVWDWLFEHNYLRETEPEEAVFQDRLPIGNDAPEPELVGDRPAVTVKYPDALTINAFELKQRDWQTALQQAKRADAYADTRWVVMDAGGVDPALDERKQFIDAGVGLLSLDESDYTVHLSPDRVGPPDTPTRQLLNERAVAEVPDEVVSRVDEKLDEVEL